MTTSLPVLPEIERLSPRVIRILGGNPGKFTLQGTNTYVLGTSTPRLLIDTGEGKPSWPPLLSSTLSKEGAPLSTALITHHHPDHVGGIRDLHTLYPSIQIHQNDTPPSTPNSHNTNPNPTNAPMQNISDGQTFSVPGATLRALHTPGHTPNHMCFHLLEEDALFTGDNVLGHGTAVFEDLGTYMRSLERMEGAFKGRAYPAHGEVIEDGRGTVREYIEHRREREGQVLQVLGESVSEEKGMTARELVEVIYKDYPRELYEPAEKGVVLILRKLEGEGKVEEVGEGRWKLVRQQEKL